MILAGYHIQGNWRDHEYTENINYDTFETLLNLLNSNMDKFTLEFNFKPLEWQD